MELISTTETFDGLISRIYLLTIFISQIGIVAAAPYQKCTYSFTVSGEDMAAVCGLRDNDIQRQSTYPSGVYSNAMIDDGTASKLLTAVTKLLEHQNVVTEVKTASQSIQELKGELVATQQHQDELISTITSLQSHIQRLQSSASHTPPTDLPFQKFPGVTSRFKGCPKHHPKRIHEVAPIRKTSNHIIKIHPRSCYEWKMRGYTLKGRYMVDPDGLEGLPPFEVECVMTADHPTAMIHHNREQRTRVVGYENPGSYRVDVNYDDIEREQLAALLESSYHCEQFLRWDCKGASITHETWWIDRHGNRVSYWGGGDEKGCACHRNNTCRGGNQCNCDTNDDAIWLEDSGYITDRSRLPVSSLRFGDTGSYNEDGYYLLGPLVCYSNATSPYEGSTALLPVDIHFPFNVFCDYDGWLIIQRNTLSKEVTFNRKWDDYKHGFGNIERDFWLGLEKLHQLTHQNISIALQITLDTGHGVRYYAQYNHFRVAGESERYRLHIGMHKGTIQDELQESNGMPFTTIDQDHDRSKTNNCAKTELSSGGWWYHNCYDVSINNDKEISWGTLGSLAMVEMKIKPMHDL